MSHSIKTVLFDLDDTLLETGNVFRTYITDLLHTLSQLANQPFELVHDIFEEYHLESYKKYAVNYNLYWPETIKQTLEHFRIDLKHEKDLLNQVLGIYTSTPKIVYGARPALERLAKTSVRIGLVTHASPEWTDFKLRSTNMLRYFTHIEVVDQNKFKGTEDWKLALNHMNANPEQTVVIGDNVKGDILAAHQLGINKLIWRKLKKGWKVYTEGELPNTVITIKSMKDVDKLILN